MVESIIPLPVMSCATYYLQYMSLSLGLNECDLKNDQSEWNLHSKKK